MAEYFNQEILLIFDIFNIFQVLTIFFTMNVQKHLCVYVHLFLVSSDLDQENIILYVTVFIRSSNLRGLYQKKTTT